MPFISTMETKSLALADILRALREDIQAENTLIASRVTWYVTSQSFLLTAYAASWNTGFLWQSFFHHVMPIAAIVLSVMILASIYAATWAQDVYLREQEALVSRINAEFNFRMPKRWRFRSMSEPWLSIGPMGSARSLADVFTPSFGSRRSYFRWDSRLCGSMR